MLGKLFSRAPVLASNTSSLHPSPSSRNPESVQEDLHTRNLLFPDAQALFEHRHDQVFPLAPTPLLPSSATSGAFDYDGDIELEERDVRVLILQSATPSSSPASLLYDSHAPAGLERQAAQDSRRNPTSPRKSSLSHTRPVIIQTDMPSPRPSAYERRVSIHSRHSYAETEAQKAHREYMEELGIFSNCIFANQEIMSTRNTSTKVHVVPTETRPNESSSSYFGDGRGSIGRSSARSSKLSQSFTSEVLSPSNPQASFPAALSAPRLAERRKVLVTRLFPVNLPSDNSSSPPASGNKKQEAAEGLDFPFPRSGDDTSMKAKPKMKKTPMYAISLVIRLPRNVPATITRPNFRVSSSYTEHGSYSSSYSSSRRSGLPMTGFGHGYESLESSYSVDMEDQLEAIMQHWDVIMRSLTRLQSTVASIISPMLKQVDLNLPDPVPSAPILQSQLSRNTAIHGRRYEDIQIKSKFNTKYIVLRANCLADDRIIKSEASSARAWIINGVRATRVITGQGRWGVWREEARTIERLFGKKDQGFFFYNLLTGFLATHTEWLQALSPLVYRKRHLQQQKAKGEEDMLLPARTVIVAPDKMSARRLVFLLSAFLPASQQLPYVLRVHRPSTNASTGPFSQSPPAGVVSIVREESLRRKLTGNRRSVPRQHLRNVSIQSQAVRAQGIPPPLAHLAFEGQHDRKSSDLSLLRQPSSQSTSVASGAADASVRKASAATTATVTPETTIPHFSTAHRRSDSRPILRPGSSGSVAADDLKRSLTRCDSTGQSSNISSDSRSQGSRWGSVISGLWSPRRRDSTSDDILTPTSAGMQSPTLHQKARKYSFVAARQTGTFYNTDQMEARDVFPHGDRSLHTPRQPDLPVHPRALESEQQDSLNRCLKRPEPPSGFDPPLKTSINAEDGVIDVEVPFPDYLREFETAVSSPSSSGYLSTTPGFNAGLEGFEQICKSGVDGETPYNVGGWLQEFHPDFVLQAISPQIDLINQVKAALKAEPTPAWSTASELEHPMADRWVDVSSALIADAVNLTITRIRYRRKVRPRQKCRDSTHGIIHASLATPSIAPYEKRLDEQYIEDEPIMIFEPAFADAVEKVISLSTPSMTPHLNPISGLHGSEAQSDNASRSSSPSVRKEETKQNSMAHADDADLPDSVLPLTITSRLPPVPTEVPRSQCRTVVLSSLEDLVLDVIAQRKRESQEDGQETIPVYKEGDSILRQTIRGWLDMLEPSD